MGQDEGGVADRVLNQFYGAAGVAFTTNHTYWRDDALLWGRSRRSGPACPTSRAKPDISLCGPDGTWRYDEITG